MNDLKVKPDTIAQLFSTEVASFAYQIPKYQREYAWTKKEWEELFNDIVSNDLGYFLGSIICIDSSIDPRGYKIFEVVDGQQRITTLSILLLGIYKKLLQFESFYPLNQDLNEELSSIKKVLVIKDNDEYIPRLVLQKQNCNNDDYDFLLFDNKILIDEHEKKLNFGKRKISKAFKFFEKQIESYIEDDIDMEKIQQEERPKKITEYVLFKKIIDLKKKIMQAMVVSITVNSASDAYILFESLNKRGMEITSLDLIKNKLIQNSNLKNKDDLALNKWEKIIKYLGDNGAVQERFFRHFYNAFRKDLNNFYYSNTQNNGPKYPLGLKATRAKFLDIYDDMIGKNWSHILDKLVENAEIYGKLIRNISLPENELILDKPLINLQHSQAAPSYVLLLYLFSKRNQLELSYEQISKIITLIMVFFVRRHITDVPATKYLDTIFIDIIDEIGNLKGNSVMAKIKQILKSKTCTDEEFKLKIKGPIYDDNIDMTRFLLCYFEENHQTRETQRNLWDREQGGSYIWTIEHIFPQGKNIPKEWVDMIANGDKEIAKTYLESHAHTLGNLTLSGYNSWLGNENFVAKRDKKDSSGNYVGYRNGLILNSDVVINDIWTVEKIEDRTEKLSNWIIDKFSI